MRGALLAGLVAIGLAGEAQAQGLPPGDGKDLLAVACTQCHGLGTIVIMREGEAGWRDHVYDMVLRGAQLTGPEADTLIGYLTANFGPAPAAANPGAEMVLPAGTGKDLVATRCTQCHDLERIVATKRASQGWREIVANMVVRGAAATPDEARTIAAYLATTLSND